jgi:hypothetical protein
MAACDWLELSCFLLTNTGVTLHTCVGDDVREEFIWPDDEYTFTLHCQVFHLLDSLFIILILFLFCRMAHALALPSPSLCCNLK